VAQTAAATLHELARDAKTQPATALVGGVNNMLRRQLLLFCGCAAVGCATPRDAAMQIDLQTLAPGVFMARGAAGEVDTSNLGRVGNAGFVQGPEGVLAIDTGTSFAHGQALMAALRRATTAPLRRALITHTRQEFLFGAPAFQAAKVPVHMHRAAAALMVSRCERCLKTLQQTLGGEAMQGTAMFKPDGLIDGAAVQDISVIGRPLQVLHFGHSSGPGDVAVWDPLHRVLFAGGLVDVQRIPDIQDSDLPGWLQALDALQALRPTIIVPGHGPAVGIEALAAQKAYLEQLHAKVQGLLESGASLLDVPTLAELPAFADWAQYDTIHRRNASVLFVRLERAWLFK
jgi:glyoxylase-like metal-dependent hydrolase (beta-lactamase superfamily II)